MNRECLQNQEERLPTPLILGGELCGGVEQNFTEIGALIFPPNKQ